MTGLRAFEPYVSTDDIVAAIEDDGAVVVRGLLGADELHSLRQSLDPLLEATQPGQEDFVGRRTRRFGALMAKCPPARDLALQPRVLEIAERVLGPYCARFQLNYTGVMYLDPGEQAQILHRDTGLYPIQNPAPPLILATMWAMTDFTTANGATCLVPGSHRWADGREPRPEEIVAAEMPAGSVLLYTGNTIHGGGANRSNATRGGLALHYSLAWLRQEENQYMAMPMTEARKLPRRLQELMGYDLGSVNLGFVDHKHPNEVLNGVAGDGPGNIGPDELLEVDNAIRRFKVSETRAVGRARFRVTAEPST